jgi:hypothetical protein
MLGRKVYSRDENVIYPNCACGKELSPFAFDMKEFEPFLEMAIEANLVIDKNETEIIVLMCKKCVKPTKLEDIR